MQDISYTNHNSYLNDLILTVWFEAKAHVYSKGEEEQATLVLLRFFGVVYMSLTIWVPNKS